MGKWEWKSMTFCPYRFMLPLTKYSTTHYWFKRFPCGPKFNGSQRRLLVDLDSKKGLFPARGSSRKASA
jgi:hypothetical protein